VALGFTRGGAGLSSAWADVAGLFAAAGQTLSALQETLAGLQGVRVVPTATALEGGGASADVYCGAWLMESP
jgi:hypothetical protein